MATTRRLTSMELVDFSGIQDDETGEYYPLLQTRRCRHPGCYGMIFYYPDKDQFACHDCGATFHHLR